MAYNREAKAPQGRAGGNTHFIAAAVLALVVLCAVGLSALAGAYILIKTSTTATSSTSLTSSTKGTSTSEPPQTTMTSPTTSSTATTASTLPSTSRTTSTTSTTLYNGPCGMIYGPVCPGGKCGPGLAPGAGGKCIPSSRGTTGGPINPFMDKWT